ncbi:MAG TPA: cytosine permease [Steroidobacteraceae bacterium]|jgi:NCS1 family nucleobase:cation symporter-1
MANGAETLSVERHGIEFVPISERYGTPRRLFTIWFSINLSLLCLTTGTLGVIAGLALPWTLIALVLGNAIGTVFMAAHSAQGPHLGIPQMIQSRAQFGVLGAALPLFAVVAEATLYTAANGVIVRETLNAILPLGNYSALMVFGLITLLIAFVGYELIHKLGAALTAISGAFLLTVAALLFVRGHALPSTAAPLGGFTLAVFISTVTQATAWNLSSAPYVADYSRYLPATVSTKATFWYTGLGNFLSATLVMGLGAYMASALPQLAGNPGGGLTELFGSGRYVVGLLIVVGLLEVNVMNLYSAYMSTVTIFTGVRSMQRVTISTKFLLMASIMAIATAIAAITKDNFNVYFADLLSVLVYVLVPWSAINLADYYLVRKGRYSIDQMFALDGIYGRYQWKCIGVYVLSVLVQIPFASLSFYVGPIARLIGADLAWLPGLVIPGILYCVIYTRESRDSAALSLPLE